MGLGGVAIAALPSMIHPKLSFSDSLGGVRLLPSTCGCELIQQTLFSVHPYVVGI